MKMMVLHFLYVEKLQMKQQALENDICIRAHSPREESLKETHEVFRFVTTYFPGFLHVIEKRFLRKRTYFLVNDMLAVHKAFAFTQYKRGFPGDIAGLD